MPTDPPWKVKTRPCPFFSKGKCLFSDSCNFIHTIKSPIAPEIRITELRDSQIRNHRDDYLDDVYGLPKQPPTPPNVVSPTFSESSPPEVDIVAPRPRGWSDDRRMSWASIHSIASADSNLTYPTDPSPTASRASSPRSADEELDDDEERYDDPHDTFDFKQRPPSQHSRHSLTSARLRSQSLGESSTRPRLPTIKTDPVTLLQLPFTAASTASSYATTAALSDPDAQIVDVRSPAPLGEAFHLEPPKPRRSQQSRDFVDLAEPAPEPEPMQFDTPPDNIRSDSVPGPSTRRKNEVQLTLNEVLVNLQDPSLRPRRINRLMMGLSPETPINSVMPMSGRSQRPPPFQGDGDWKSEIFRRHLANLISNRSEQIHQAGEGRSFEMPPGSGRLPFAGLPESAPPSRLAFLQDQAPRASPETRRINMTEIPSPAGQAGTAFKRPARPARKRTGQLTPLGLSPMLPDDSDTMSPPPLAPLPETPPPRPSSARIGSLTLTPLHESPADFRTESVRKNFSPLEDEDAAAALDVLGQYEPDETIVVAKPKPKRSSPSKLKERTISIPRTQTLVSIEQVLDAPMDVDTSMPVDASMSMDVQMILDTPMVLGAPIEMEEALPLVESPPPNEPIETLSPKPHFKPLRLSVLFDQVKATTPSATSLDGSPFSTPHRGHRRPLSALLPDPLEPTQETDTTPQPSSRRTNPSPSPTPRRRQPGSHLMSPPMNPLNDLTYTQESPEYPLTSTPQRTPKSSILFTSHSQHSASFSQHRNQHGPRNNPFSPPASRTPTAPSTQPRSAPMSIQPQSARMSRSGHSRAGSSVSSISSASSTASTSAKPLLFFAVAKDDVAEVERLLASGEATANDRAGPDDLPALLFTMGNEGLKNKTEIVKTLLSYGADPSVLHTMTSGSGAGAAASDAPASSDDEDDDARRDSMMTVRPSEKTPTSPTPKPVQLPPRQKTMAINPEIDYYLSRVPELPAKQLEALRNAGFDPLTRMPFRLVGQDLVLQELLRVLARHSQRGSTSPVSIIFAGPSGHGKSLLSRSIGELLRIPAHTVNMTNLRTQDELLLARSLSSTNGEVTLAKFLSDNEGKRCAVILEEIEKVADKSAANTLLMPWELGKLNTSSRAYDTSRVIWISTSNAGEDIVFEFERDRGSRPCDRNEYLDLATSIRRKLIESLGASLVSRITTVLPFLAFTEPEKLALAYQHLPSNSNSLSKGDLDALLEKVVQDYIPSEGVRSIQRAVERHYEEEFW